MTCFCNKICKDAGHVIIFMLQSRLKDNLPFQLITWPMILDSLVKFLLVFRRVGVSVWLCDSRLDQHMAIHNRSSTRITDDPILYSHVNLVSFTAITSLSQLACVHMQFMKRSVREICCKNKTS